MGYFEKIVNWLGLIFSGLAPICYGGLSMVWRRCNGESVCSSAWSYSALWLLALTLLFLILGFGFSLKYYTQSVLAKLGLMISVTSILIVIVFIFNDPDIVPSILTSILSEW